MAGQGMLSPQINKLLEKTIDGASLIYDSVEAHNCEQLKRKMAKMSWATAKREKK